MLIDQTNALLQAAKQQLEGHRSTEQAIDAAIGTYIELGSIIEALKGLQNDAKLLLTEIAAETGELEFAGSVGSASVSRSYSYPQYRKDDLAAFAKRHPEFAEEIAACATTINVSGGLTIRAKRGK